MVKVRILLYVHVCFEVCLYVCVSVCLWLYVCKYIFVCVFATNCIPMKQTPDLLPGAPMCCVNVSGQLPLPGALVVSLPRKY